MLVCFWKHYNLAVKTEFLIMPKKTYEKYVRTHCILPNIDLADPSLG